MTHWRWLSLKEAAEYCRNMTPETVRRAIVAGECRGYQLKPGGKWRVRTVDLDAWLMGEMPHTKGGGSN
jgi:excisionase family DNA binding protein